MSSSEKKKNSSEGANSHTLKIMQFFLTVRTF